MRRDEVVVLDGQTQQSTFASEAPLQDVFGTRIRCGSNLL
jgi:hypothetical protein